MPEPTAWLVRSAPALGAVLLAGCAAMAAERPVARYVADLQAEPGSAAALVDRLQAVAGLPVLRPVALAPRRWAFSLQCDRPAACDAAADRLRAEPGLLRHLEPDPPVLLPPRPRGEAAR